MNPLYTRAQLEAIGNRNSIWTICKERGLKCLARTADCIDLILESQPAQAPVTVEETMTSTTCASCPFFESYNEPSGRGYCPCNDRVVYAHHEKSQECDRSREIEAEFIQPKSWAQAQAEVETYLEAQAQEVAPEPELTGALSGDNVAIRLQPEIIYDPRTESKPEAIAFLTAFLAHTAGRDVPEVARAEWDQCNILTGGYYCNEWEEIINVKVVINWKAGTYQRNDTFCDGALAAVWGNLRGIELSHINFDFSRLPIDSAKQERRAAVLQYRFTEAIAIIATVQPGVVERVTLDSVVVRLEDGSLKEVAPDEIKHVEAPWKGVKWNDLSPGIRRILKGYNPSQNVLDKHKKELVRVIKK
ncbi:hypothetical protein [Coleofasciculus sp. FACHB-T130]|uniref:hypothetical protein n=1 Tax=Cyanophyceae TaxID=3028117 RepID=UPI0016834BEF|nr:hypothetical protein [Coleofasciculus sp. FACHB-T130]MBD1878351.1 hypothetical protein [Coleofasciculus sp. FACHB-T130]